MSPSSSESASVSPSSSQSPSASPSFGYTGYTRGNYGALPTNTADLETLYTSQDVTDVGSNNGVRVGQAASGEYAIHQFKDFVADSNALSFELDLQSTLAPTSSTVYLEAYNHTAGEWETLTSNNGALADTDFTLTASLADATNYKDGSNVVTCRVYQEGV